MTTPSADLAHGWAPSAELAHGWASSGWVIGMLPIHLGQTSSTSSSIAATKRASTEGGPFGIKSRNDNFTHPFGGDGGGGGGGGFGGGTPYHLNTRAWKLGKQVFACE